MSFLPSVVEAAIIAPTCLVVGFVAGVKYQHRKLTREVAMQAREVKTWLDAWGWYAVAAFLLVMALLMYQSQRETSQARDVSRSALVAVQTQNTCLTTFANRLYDSLHPRQTASEALQKADEHFNDALVALLEAALSGHAAQATERGDAVQLAAAAQHKQQVADMLSTERAKNPYPQPPKKVCPK